MAQFKKITIYNLNESLVKSIEIKAERCLKDMARDSYNFYVHQDPFDTGDGLSENWAVTEETSGGAVARASTKKKALFYARQKLNSVSLEAFKTLVDKCIKKRKDAKAKEVDNPLWLALATNNHILTSEEVDAVIQELKVLGYEIISF